MLDLLAEFAYNNQFITEIKCQNCSRAHVWDIEPSRGKTNFYCWSYSVGIQRGSLLMLLQRSDTGRNQDQKSNSQSVD